MRLLRGFLYALNEVLDPGCKPKEGTSEVAS
jgi:hypothetical protein